MKFGVVFPQTEIGNDPEGIKRYALRVEELGLHHILTYEHVLGANPKRPGGWKGTYSSDDTFHEPFVLYGFMAAVTTTLEFLTGVLVLPQRQTPLVAKQASTLDILTGGRIRLGIGIGWNAVEFDGMGENFRNRGKRVEEQIELLRLLWTRPLITYKGKWHKIIDSGLNPLPIQRPIPIWIGGGAEVVLKRVARLGDGWLPPYPKPDGAVEAIKKLERYMQEAGRSMKDVGIEPRIRYDDGNLDTMREDIQMWKKLGASHLSLNTMNCGLRSPEEHLEAIEKFSYVALPEIM